MFSTLPFFMSAVPQLEENAEGRMTGDVSKTAREVLTGCFGFNVRFADWSTLATDIAGDTELQSELRMYDRWGELLYEFLNETSVAEIVEADE
mmetsp:Transcript_20556/g.35059  ORF Transcript_20556/g.35059 Transcript_20556/m.35059 type:complete len:93 (-) Transcript_20556:465-743(-)